MFEPNAKEMGGLDISFELSERQRSVLASAVQQEWFDILQKLMEEEIRNLNVQLINTDGADAAAIVANHHIAKGAAQFYKGFINRLRTELLIETYNAARLGTPEHPEEGPSLS